MGVAAAMFLAGCTISSARNEQERIAGRLADPACVDSCMADALPDIVAYALEHRPSMKSAELDVRDARATMAELVADAPLASAYPWRSAHIDVGASYGESSRSAHFSDFKAKTRKGDAAATLSIGLTIYDFGRWDAQVRAQAERTLAAESSMTAEGYAIFEEVAGAYFTLAQNVALWETAQSNVVQWTEHLREAEGRFDEGEAQELDVLTAKLNLASAREAAVAASNDIATARAQLAHAAGCAALPALDGGAVAEHWLKELDSSAEELFETARTNAPAMLVARARVKAASAQVDYAVADLLPDFSANISLNWTDPLWYWRWAANAAQNLFAGGRSEAAVERAVTAMLKAESDLDAVEQALYRDIVIATSERSNAIEAENAAMDSLRQAEENHSTVESRYDTGEATRTDLADATAAMASARANIIKARCRRQKAAASLYALAGRDAQYNQERKTP